MKISLKVYFLAVLFPLTGAAQTIPLNVTYVCGGNTSTLSTALRGSQTAVAA